MTTTLNIIVIAAVIKVQFKSLGCITKITIRLVFTTYAHRSNNRHLNINNNNPYV